MPRMTATEIERFVDETFPQARALGWTIEDIGDRTLRLRLPVGTQQLRPGGTVSGPTLMTLVDTAYYFALLAAIGPVALAVTTNLSIDFLQKPGLADLIADARILKLGKRLAVGDVTIWQEGVAGPVAHANVTYSIPSPDYRP